MNKRLTITCLDISDLLSEDENDESLVEEVDMFSLKEFTEAVANGLLNNCDGCGYLVKNGIISNIVVYPSAWKYLDKEGYDSVAWYNK